MERALSQSPKDVESVECAAFRFYYDSSLEKFVFQMVDPDSGRTLRYDATREGLHRAIEILQTCADRWDDDFRKGKAVVIPFPSMGARW